MKNNQPLTALTAEATLSQITSAYKQAGELLTSIIQTAKLRTMSSNNS